MYCVGIGCTFIVAVPEALGYMVIVTVSGQSTLTVLVEYGCDMTPACLCPAFASNDEGYAKPSVVLELYDGAEIVA